MTRKMAHQGLCGTPLCQNIVPDNCQPFCTYPSEWLRTLVQKQPSNRTMGAHDAALASQRSRTP
jgi:hypothetical protein